MKRLSLAAVIASAIALSACSTTQEVVLAKAAPNSNVATAAQTPEDGNSPEMDKIFKEALQLHGITVNAALPPGARKAPDVDVVVSYADVWRWDLVMYLQSLTIRMYDASSGDLLVMGQWKDAPMHGFNDARVIAQELLADMMGKLRGAGGAQAPIRSHVERAVPAGPAPDASPRVAVQGDAASRAAAATGLPEAGTTWTYQLEDQVFRGGKVSVTVKVVRSDAQTVEEYISSSSASAPTTRRAIDAQGALFFAYAVGANTNLVEFAPYLVAARGKQPRLMLNEATNYPVGRPGLPGWTVRVKAVSWGQVAVPAGTYRALRIEAEGERTSNISSQSTFAGAFSLTAWYAPDVKRYVRLEHRVWSSNMLNRKLIGHDVVELLAYRPPS